MGIWVVSNIWLLWIMSQTFVYKFLFGYIFSFFLDMYLEVQWLGHMITQCLTFWGTTKLFTKVAAPFHSHQQYMKVPVRPHPYHIYRLPFLLWHSSGCVVVSHSLICISLRINDVEHLSVCLLAIFISFLEKYLFRYLCPFLIRLFILLLLSSLYMLDKSLFSDIYDLQIAPYFPPFHGLGDRLICRTKAFNFDIVQFIYFFFCHLYFWYYTQGNHYQCEFQTTLLSTHSSSKMLYDIPVTCKHH